MKKLIALLIATQIVFTFSCEKNEDQLTINTLTETGAAAFCALGLKRY